MRRIGETGAALWGRAAVGAVVLVAVGPAVSAAAGPYDGLYRPNYDWAESWDCTTIGADGGALQIEEQSLRAVDNSCTLADPVEIRDMNAHLYDATCTGEGETTRGRVLLMRHAFGVYVIRDGFVLDWIACGGE